MRDILSKLDSIISETALNPNNPKGDYEAKKQALQDLENDPVAGNDPEISKAIDQRRADLEKEAKTAGIFEIGDDFGISVSEDFEIGTSIVDILEDGVVVSLDETAINYLAQHGFTFEDGELVEGVAGPKSCWKGYRKVGTKPGTGKNAGKRVNDCEKIGEDFEEQTNEAEYQGRNVPLGKPMKGDVKKSKVYVKNPQGNVVKVNFGDKKMRIKKSNPNRRKSFRARHNCDNPGPRHKARYWSCRAW
jgi:sorbitol-specific phosphotransferase system component IIA